MFRKRWLRWFARFTFISLLLGAVGIAIDRFFTRRAGEKRLAEITERLDREDPRWRLEEIEADRGQLADEENGCLLVPRFQAALAKPAVVADSIVSSKIWSTVSPNRALDDDTYEAITAALNRDRKALAVALEFQRFPKGLRKTIPTPLYLDTQLPETNQTRLACNLLDWSAECECRDGRGGRSLANLRSMLNASRSLATEPFAVSALARMACLNMSVRRLERTLGMCEPRRALEPIQSELLREAESDLFWHAFRGDRAGLHQLFTNLQAGKVSLRDFANAGGAKSSSPLDDLEWWFSSWFFAPYWAEDHALTLELLAEIHDARRLSEPEQRTEIDRVCQKFKALNSLDPGANLTKRIVPAHNKIFDAALRCKANLRCAATALAIERFRVQFGRWPDSLEEIPKPILISIPRDPFDGEPLRFRPASEGVIVYSVGFDGINDDGANDRIQNWNIDGQDIVFRLYAPSQRALPSLPLSPKGRASILQGPMLRDNPAGESALELGPKPREISK